MKASIKISVAFSILLVGSMFTLFLLIKNHEKDAVKCVNFKNIELPIIKVLVAEKGADVHITQSDSNYISIEYLKNKKTHGGLYKISGDTLHIYAGSRTFIKCNNIETVIGNQHFWLGIYKFTPDSITLKLMGGKTFINNHGQTKKSMNIALIAKDSAFIDIQSLNCNKLSAKLTNSNLDIYCSVRNLSANMKDKAHINLSKTPRTIQLESDSISHMTMSYN